jgi:hypothetical protein
MSVRGTCHGILSTTEGVSRCCSAAPQPGVASAHLWLPGQAPVRDRSAFHATRASVVSWGSGWIRIVGASGATRRRQRSERYGKGSPSRQGAVGRLSIGRGDAAEPRHRFSLSPKQARANTSATSSGSSQRELRDPESLEPALRSVMPLECLQALQRGR